MTGKKNMLLFYFSISLAILSSALYHFSQKQIPANVNPAISVLVTYAISFGICLGLLYFFLPEDGILSALRRLNWASYLLAFSLVGLEVGFLLVYRSGWYFGLASVLVNVLVSLFFLPVALFAFIVKLSLVKIYCILVS